MEEPNVSGCSFQTVDQEDPVAGQAVQIVNIKKIPKRPSQFVLEKTVLRQILKDVGNRNVCVLSITGASRQGKSFLMNVIRHYLQEMENEVESPWENICQLDSLEGFHIENRNVRDTIGFWMWSKPFIFKQSDGNEIAVLLMDTQGVFDQYSTKREWAMIVGLSMLTSSCVIYNLLNNLQEDNLEIVSSFVEFGMLTLEKDQTATSAFQKLLFLIRDWGFPYDTAYGSVGGSKFIQDKLATNSEMPVDLRKVRETLRSVFEDIECFLMPNPGEAAKQNNYTGSLKHLHPVFLKHLEEFLSNLLIIDDLPSLRIAGKKVPGQSLANYFAKYVDLMNKQEMPTAKLIYEAAAEANLEAVTQEYVDQVKSEVNDAINQEGFLVDVQLKKEYESSCKKAMANFRDKYRGKEPGFIVHYTGVLLQQLKTLFSTLHSNNQECRNAFIARLLEQAGNNFKRQVETALKGTTQTAPDMEVVLNECQESVLQTLDIGNRTEDFFDELLVQLRPRIDELASAYRQNNATKLESVESKYRTHFDSLLRDYEEKIEVSIPFEELSSTTAEKLLKVHKRCEDSIIQKLQQIVSFENERLKETAINELKSLTWKEVSKRMEVVQNTTSVATSKAMELVQQAINEYCHKMTDFLEKTIKPTERQLLSEHRTLKTDATEHMNRLPYIMKDFLEVQKIKDILDEKIRESFQLFQTTLKENQQQFLQDWKSAVSMAVSQYELEITKLISGLPHPGEQQFTQQKQSIGYSIAVAAAKNGNLSDTDKEDLRKEIEMEFQGMEEKLWTSYKSIIKDAQDSCTDDAREFAQEYLRKLQEHLEKGKDQMTIQKFHNLSYSLADETKRAFESKWMKTLSAPDIYPTVNQLVSFMNNESDKILKELESNIQKLSLLLEGIVDECCDLYISEMDDKIEEVSELSVLEKNHNVILRKAEKEFNRQMKEYSSLPQADEIVNKFKNKIIVIYKDKEKHVKSNLQDFKQFLERTQLASTDVYRMHLSKERATISNEQEFKVAHEEGLKLALKCLKQKMSEKKSISFHEFHEQETKLEASLENELESQKKEWNSLNHAIDQETRKVMQNIMEKYQEVMNESLEKCDFLTEANLESKHAEILRQNLQFIRQAKKPPNADPKVYEQQLTTALNNTFLCFKNENQEKRRMAESKVSKYILERKNSYSKWLTTQKSPNKDIVNAERDKYQQGLRQYCSQFKVPGGIVQEFIDKSKAEMAEAFDSAYEEWEKIEPNEADLELSVIKAREIYEQEMKSHVTRESPLLHSVVLKLYHKKAMDKARKAFESRVKQTAKAKQRLEEAFEVDFQRYQDENDAKATDAGHIAVGIDLGTTYSCVGVYRKGQVEIIPDMNNGMLTVPSYVLFETKDNVVVGEEAKDQSVIYPHSTIFDSKRLIGRRFNDQEVKNDINLWPFRVLDDNTRPKVVVHEESFYPEEISGKILTHLKKNAEKHLGHEVKRAVITVPAYFTDAQKRATRAAADFAGLEVLELLAEPTAAAIAYNFHYNDDKGRSTFVYDLGGGTFDVSILTSQKGKMEVKAVGGNNHLGGQDFDNAMVKYCIAEFNRTHNAYLENVGTQQEKDARIRRIRNRCEKAKINLSKSEKVRVVIDRLYLDKDLDVEITREQFNRMIQSMLQETINIANEALAQSGLAPQNINDVVLVGGSSRIPKAQEMLKELFARDGLSMALNPDEVVARGAAYRAAMLSGAKERELGNIKFNNVTPFALGTAVVGDRLSIIIPKNTPVPCKKVQDYYTFRNNQTRVGFDIYEGENPVASRNNLLGQFTLANIPAARAGREPIDVTMELDEGGLLNVTAVVRSTGGSRDIQINTSQIGLTKDEIEEQKARHQEQK